MNINLNSDKAWGILKTIEKAELKLTLFLLSRNLIKLSSDQEKEMTRLAEYANNKLFTRFIKNDYSDFLKNFESQIDLMANMLNKGKIDSDLVTNLLESVSYFKGVNFECIPDYENNYKRLLLVSLFVESLNFNVVSCGYIFNELSSVLSKFNQLSMSTSEKVLLSFSSSFYKGEKTKADDQNYDLHKTIKEAIHVGLFKNYYSIIADFKRNGSKYATKYFCDDLNYFYCLRDEIFPIDVDSMKVSTINRKLIKGKCVFIKDAALSQSQALERFKFNPKALLDYKSSFIPY